MRLNCVEIENYHKSRRRTVCGVVGGGLGGGEGGGLGGRVGYI